MSELLVGVGFGLVAFAVLAVFVNPNSRYDDRETLLLAFLFGTVITLGLLLAGR